MNERCFLQEVPTITPQGLFYLRSWGGGSGFIFHCPLYTYPDLHAISYIQGVLHPGHRSNLDPVINCTLSQINPLWSWISKLSTKLRLEFQVECRFKLQFQVEYLIRRESVYCYLCFHSQDLEWNSP